MKRLIFTILLLTAAPAVRAQSLPVIPAPQEVVLRDGTPDTVHELSRKIGGKAFARKTASLPADIRDEAYSLTVTPKGYRIEANTPTGCFRALQTLSQVDRCCTIYDYPRFPYRGFMLDISRHFRDKDFILKQLDALASVKVNVLHLHLTDDAGWRLQIDSHPELTEQAAWRKGRTWSEWNTTGQRYATAQDPEAAGGFLTKEDVREILEKAERLHITVIPEIEMPGHSKEVIRAFPALGCFPQSNEFCPGKEETFRFLEDVLDEVAALFPSPYIHIGGDEASKQDWGRCPDCLRRMREEGLESKEELQSYLIRRIERYINGMGRSLIGWDEILEGGLSPHATVMSWRGTEGGIQAMREGHEAIMTPGRTCYINNAQDAPIFEPSGQGGYLPLDSVYRYEPLDGVPEALHPLLKGIQANLWQEYVATPEHTEYMTYPRIAALAERGWSAAGVRDDFRERVLSWSDALRDGTLTGEAFRVFDLRAERGERLPYREGVSHLGLGAEVRYATPAHPNYPAAGTGTLTDGRCGGWSFGDRRWQGFLSDIDVTLDLGSVREIHYAGATFLSSPGPGIYLPERVVFSLSEDGETFTEALVLPNENGFQSNGYILFGGPVQGKARYVRMQAARHREWLFTDEVVVN